MIVYICEKKFNDIILQSGGKLLVEQDADTRQEKLAQYIEREHPFPPKNTIDRIQDVLKNTNKLMEWGSIVNLNTYRNQAASIFNWIKKNKNYDPNLFTITLLIILKESRYGSLFNKLRPENWFEVARNRNMKGQKVPDWSPLYPGKKLYDNSVGPAQIKPSVAKQYNLDMEKYLSSVEGAISETYKLVQKYYNTVKNFYSGKYNTKREGNSYVRIPSLGGLAENYAILVAHNAGLGWVNKKYCQTNDSNFAAPCDKSTYQPLEDKPNFKVKVYQKNPIINFLPHVKATGGADYGTYRYLFKENLDGPFNELRKIPNLVK